MKEKRAMNENSITIFNAFQIFSILKDGSKTRNEIWELLDGETQIKNTTLSNALKVLMGYYQPNIHICITELSIV